MKRIIALLLAIALLFALSACSKKETKSDPIQDGAEAASQAAAQAEADAQAEAAAQESGETAADNTGDGFLSVDTPNTDDNAIAELNAATGANIARPTVVQVDSESCEVVQENGAQIAQYTFLSGSVAGGIRFCADPNVDISGVTDENGNGPFDGTDQDVVNLGGALMGRWTAPNGQYVLIAVTEDEEYFNLLLEEMKAVTGA